MLMVPDLDEYFQTSDEAVACVDANELFTNYPVGFGPGAIFKCEGVRWQIIRLAGEHSTDGRILVYDVKELV